MTIKLPEHHGLSEKELAFALAYIELGPINGRKVQAAVKAGFDKKYASQTANKLLKKPSVLAYVRAREGALMRHIEENQIITREWIVAQLKLVYAQSMIGEPEMVWEGGKMKHSGLWTFNDRGANKALELLGRTIGMFEPAKSDEGKPRMRMILKIGNYKEENPIILEHD